MANYYASLAMALPKDEIPERLECLEDLIPLYKDGASLHSNSRRNWLICAVEACAAHYNCPRLSYLIQSASVLDPVEATLAAEEITAILQADASPWGPLVESDDGNDLPYLVSFLSSQLALLRYAAEHNLHVAYAQTVP